MIPVKQPKDSFQGVFSVAILKDLDVSAGARSTPQMFRQQHRPMVWIIVPDKSAGEPDQDVIEFWTGLRLNCRLGRESGDCYYS
jgi:hypothetical protein